MKNKNTIKKITVMALCFSFAISAASCGEGMITTNSDKDMAQIVATVDISNHNDFKADGKYAEYAEVISNMDSKIKKSDLIAYFLNVGYQYVNNYGKTYKETFELLMQNLVSRKIMVQYAMAYYFDLDVEGEKKYTIDEYNAYIEKEKTEAPEELKVHYEAHPEILTMKYFITENGSDSKDYDKAIYNLKKSVNSSLDAVEKEIVKKDDAVNENSESPRTTPSKANKETEDYYATSYEIYTGRNTLDSCGEYESVNNSTQTTRKKAYNSFISRLSNNNLIDEKENTTDFTKLDYYYVELAAQLEQALIVKYSDDLDEEAAKEFTKEYVEKKYNDLLKDQEILYSSSQESFNGKLDSVSDTSFLVYSPVENFGFVYNILLPFSETQKQLLTTYKNDKGITESERFNKRADLLKNIKGKDLRNTWISTNEDNNNSFVATGDYYKNAFVSAQENNYLFFEDNLTKSEGENARYEELGQYYGQYPYNGKAEEKNDKFVFTPNEMDIDEFMQEMEAYLAYAGLTVTGAKSNKYVADGNYTLDGTKFDYSEFIYYEGKVDVGENTAANRSNFFKKGEKAYTAASVMNELMFAYSTDPGCLNKYLGYSVSPYKTSFMPEFEYAAQYALKKGPGTFVVSPTDYGWHIIYATFVYPAGEVYTFDWEQREVEGTFSYTFYEALKTNNSGVSSATMKQNEILTTYNTDTCVKLYENRYQDLLNLDKKA